MNPCVQCGGTAVDEDLLCPSCSVYSGRNPAPDAGRNRGEIQ